MTTEEQIAQLEAMRETLLPLELTAWTALEPVRVQARALRVAHEGIARQIGAIDSALEVLGVIHTPIKRYT